MASVPHSIPIPPFSNARSSQVGAASQTPTTPRISTLSSHLNVTAATPYSSSLPHRIIPNSTLSHPSPTITCSVESCQHRRGNCIRHTHHRPSTRLNRGPCYTMPIVSPDSNPNAPCFRLSPPSSRTILTDFTTNGPYSPPTRISNFMVSCENSRDSSRRSSRSTVWTRSRSCAVSRSYDMFSMLSESPKPPQSVAFTASPSWRGQDVLRIICCSRNSFRSAYLRVHVARRSACAPRSIFAGFRTPKSPR